MELTLDLFVRMSETKKHNMKKIIILSELLFLAVMSMGITACSDEEKELEETEKGYFNGQWYYKITSPDEVSVSKAMYNIRSKISLPSEVKIQGVKYRVTSLGNGAFTMCESLPSITIPNSVTSIGSHAFHGCLSLSSVTIPNSVTYIGPWAFYTCASLTSITIPNSVTSIEDNTFNQCLNLASVTIPNSVTSIGSYAFLLCRSLTSIDIPSSVTSIGPYAFGNCKEIAQIRCKAMTPPVIGNAFEDEVYHNATLYVPAGTVNAYKDADYWKLFNHIVEE